MHLYKELTDKYDAEIYAFQLNKLKDSTDKKLTREHVIDYAKRAIVKDKIATADVNGLLNVKDMIRFGNKKYYLQAVEIEYERRKNKINEIETNPDKALSYDFCDLRSIKMLKSQCINLLLIKEIINSVQRQEEEKEDNKDNAQQQALSSTQTKQSVPIKYQRSKKSKKSKKSKNRKY